MNKQPNYESEKLDLRVGAFLKFSFQFYLENLKSIALIQVVFFLITGVLCYQLPSVLNIMSNARNIMDIALPCIIFPFILLTIFTQYFISMSQICLYSLDGKKITMKDLFPGMGMYLKTFRKMGEYCVRLILIFFLAIFILILGMSFFRFIFYVFVSPLTLLFFLIPGIYIFFAESFFMGPFLILDRGFRNEVAYNLTRELTKRLKKKIYFIFLGPVYLFAIVIFINFHLGVYSEFGHMKSYFHSGLYFGFNFLSLFVLSYVITVQALLYRILSSVYFEDMTAPEEIENWDGS